MKLNTDLTASLNAVTGFGNNTNPNDGTPLQLAPDLIQADPEQPRKSFDKKALQELAHTLAEDGMIQPIIVCRVDDIYQLVAGERRLRAAKLAGLETVPVIVRQTTQNDYAQVIENDQRENLTALELAAFIQKKLNDGDNQATIAKRLGRSKSWVSEHHKLNTAPESVRQALATGKIKSARTAADVAALYDTHEPDAVSAAIENSDAIGRNDVSELSEKLPSSSRRTPAKKARAKGKKKARSSRRTTPKNNPVLQSITAKQSREIGITKPLIVCWQGKRSGCIAFNYTAETRGHVWVLFDDTPEHLEQVKITDVAITQISGASNDSKQVRKNKTAKQEPIT